MGAGPIKTQGRQGIHLAVDLSNALFQRIEAIQGRDFPAFQTRVDFIGGGPIKFGHLAFL